jgi:hypothetical protein
MSIPFPPPRTDQGPGFVLTKYYQSIFCISLKPPQRSPTANQRRHLFLKNI